MFRYILFVCLMCFGNTLFGSAAMAADWLVARVAQPAVYAVDSKTWNRLSAGMNIPAGSWVNTGKTGRVMLRRNGDTIIVQPNTLTGVGGPKNSSSLVSIQHEIGQILLDVNKGKKARVKVKTHHLTAVVKGTQFSVSSTNAQSTVAVGRGLVGVSDNATGQSANVGPGQSASSSGQGGLGVSAAASSSNAASGRGSVGSGEGGGSGDRGGRANGSSGNNGSGNSNGGSEGDSDGGDDGDSGDSEGDNSGSDDGGSDNGNGNNGNGVGNGGGNGTGNEGNGQGPGGNSGHGGNTR